MIRIVRGSPATLSAVFSVDEVATDLTVPPTVVLTRVDGSQAATGTATRTAAGTYTFPVPPQSLLTVLKAVWTGTRAGVAVSETTYAEIVGAQYFTVSELRGFDSVLSSSTKYPTSKMIQARLYVETEFEGICGRAFVPRYAREVLYGDGCGTLWLANPQLLRVVSVTVDGVDWSGKDYSVPEYNLRVLNVADATWPRGGRIVLEYEYGMQEPPVRIKQAAMKRTKYALVADVSRIDERATTMNIPDFGNFVLATPGMRGSFTGIPEVDVVLQDYVIGGSVT